MAETPKLPMKKIRKVASGRKKAAVIGGRAAIVPCTALCFAAIAMNQPSPFFNSNDADALGCADGGSSANGTGGKATNLA